MPTGKDRQTAVPESEGPMPGTMSSDPLREVVMGRRFTVIDSFKSEELKSEYVAGLSYEARDEDEKLLGLLDQWIKEGKVREGGPEAQMSGTDEDGKGDD